MSYKQELKLNNQELQTSINKTISLNYNENLDLPLNIQDKLILLLQESINEKTKDYIPPTSTFELNRSSNIKTGTLNVYNEGFFDVLLIPILINGEVVWKDFASNEGEIADVVYNKLIVAAGHGAQLISDSCYGINTLYNHFDIYDYIEGYFYCFLSLVGHNMSADYDGYIHFSNDYAQEQ